MLGDFLPVFIRSEPLDFLNSMNQGTSQEKWELLRLQEFLKGFDLSFKILFKEYDVWKLQLADL